MCEVDTPDTCQLHTVIGLSGFIALEETLVHQLYRPGLREIGIVAVIGCTHEGCLLETASGLTQTTIVLYMGCEGASTAKTELTRDLRVGTLKELITQVEVDEIVPRAPLIGLELLDGDSDLLTAILLVRVDVTAEVVVKLDVLCVCADGSYCHQGD